MDGIEVIAVWLDHSKAVFYGFKDGQSFVKENVESPYNPRKRFNGEKSDVTRFDSQGNAVSNNEDRKHNRKQKELNEYYNILEGKISEYDEILLFGPGRAKDELHNRLEDNKRFFGKMIAVKSVGKLTENQTLAFVREFFDTVN